MNKNGQVLILKFMIAVTIFVIVLAMAPLISDINIEARSPSNLDCDNNSISNFDKLGCLSSDSSLFLIVTGGLFIAFAVFTIKRLDLR